MRQSKVDKLYAGLKDLAEERRGKLDERHRLFQLNREVDDLEQWIAEREVVAGSHELGQDYEHVTASTAGRAPVVVWFCGSWRATQGQWPPLSVSRENTLDSFQLSGFTPW